MAELELSHSLRTEEDSMVLHLYLVLLDLVYQRDQQLFGVGGGEAELEVYIFAISRETQCR